MDINLKEGLLIVLIILLVILIIRCTYKDNMANYGREINERYFSWPYNPEPEWTAVDKNYGYACTLGGNCELVKGGLLTKEECNQCYTDKILWKPPWTVIT